MWSTESLYGSQHDPTCPNDPSFLDGNLLVKTQITSRAEPQVGKEKLLWPQSYWEEREVRDCTDIPKATRIGLENKGIYGWWRTTSASPCPGSITYYHPQRNWQDYGKKLEEVSKIERARHELETLGQNDHTKVAELLRTQEKLRGEQNRCYCDGHQGKIVLNNQISVSWLELQKPLMLATSLFRLASSNSTSPELLAPSSEIHKIIKHSRLSWCIFQFRSEHWHPKENWHEGAPIQYGWLERILGTHIAPSIGGQPDGIYNGNSKYEGNKRIPLPRSHSQIHPIRFEDLVNGARFIGSLPSLFSGMSSWLKPIHTGEGSKILDDEGFKQDDELSRGKKRSVVEQERGCKTTRTLLKEYAAKNAELRKERSKVEPSFRRKPRAGGSKKNEAEIEKLVPEIKTATEAGGDGATTITTLQSKRGNLISKKAILQQRLGGGGEGLLLPSSAPYTSFKDSPSPDSQNTTPLSSQPPPSFLPNEVDPWPTNKGKNFHVLSSSTSSENVFRDDLGKRRFLFEGWRRRPRVNYDGAGSNESIRTETSSISSGRLEIEESSGQKNEGFFKTCQKIFHFLTKGDDETIWMPKEYKMDKESFLRFQEIENSLRNKEVKILKRNIGLQKPLIFTLSDFLEAIMPCMPESVLGENLRHILRQNCGMEAPPVDQTLEDELKRSVAYNLMKEESGENPNALSDILGYNIGKFSGVGSIQDELTRIAPLPTTLEPAGCSILDMLDPLKKQVDMRFKDLKEHCAANPNHQAISGFDLLEKVQGGGIVTDDDELTQPWWLSDDPNKREETRTELAEVVKEYKSINRKIRLYRAEQEHRHTRPWSILLENPEHTLRKIPCWPQTKYQPNSHQYSPNRCQDIDLDQPQDSSPEVLNIGVPTHLRTTFGNFCQIKDYRRKPHEDLYDDGLGSASCFLNDDAYQPFVGKRQFSNLPLLQTKIKEPAGRGSIDFWSDDD